MSKAKERLTAEMVKGYHNMAMVRMQNAQEIINALGDVGVDVNDQIEGAALLQTALDNTARILWRLRDGGAAIDQEVLNAFDQFNQNIVAFNNANHQTLVQPRRIGDITEMQGDVVVETGSGYHNANSTNHVPYGEDNHGHGHGHYHAVGEHQPLIGNHQDSGCCGGCIMM